MAHAYTEKDTRTLKWEDGHHTCTFAQTDFVQGVSEPQGLHACLQLRHESFGDIFLANTTVTVRVLGCDARSVSKPKIMHMHVCPTLGVAGSLNRFITNLHEQSGSGAAHLPLVEPNSAHDALHWGWGEKRGNG